MFKQYILASICNYIIVWHSLTMYNLYDHIILMVDFASGKFFSPREPPHENRRFVATSLEDDEERQGEHLNNE